jgi:F-type H+-transporting ATPase subunit a
MAVFHMEGIHISLKAETLGHFWGIAITNTLIMSLLITLILSSIAFFISKRRSILPSKIQVILEILIGGVYGYIKETLEDDKLAKKFFPLIITIFFFVLLANWIQFLPGIGSIGFFENGSHGKEFVPLLRSMNTDLNITLALAIIAFFAIEIAGIIKLGSLRYFSKFVNFHSPLGFLIGIIDLFSELARLISFSFRLFGNIFAGEVMIAIVIFFVPVILPVPMLLFEVFVGFIQASIFALLTLFFIKIAITESH